MDDTNTYAKFGPCPKGHYCPEGSAAPFRCPPGTYNELERKYDKDLHCLACDPGYFGETSGLKVSTCTGKCAAGFYCSGGTSSHSPLGTNGNKCREGTYCPEGSIEEIVCPPGTYNPNKGQKECFDCPEGYYCPGGDPDNAANNSPIICPQGHACVVATGDIARAEC